MTERASEEGPGPADAPDEEALGAADFDLLLDQLLAIAGFDFGRRLPVDHGSEGFRALALGLNILTEELESVLLSRDEAVARWGKVFELAPIGMALADESGCFIAVNAAFAKMLGRTGDEMLMESWQTLTHPDDLAVGVSAVADLYAGRVESIEMEKRYLTKAGEPVWGRLLATLIRDESGVPLYSIAQIVDVSEQKRTAGALRIARDRALSSDRMKTEFLRNVSHEIRTPMTTIIGMTELVLGTELLTEQREYLQLARSAGATLLTLVDDILSLSKIEAGGLDPDVTVFDPVDAVRQIVAPLRGTAAMAGIGFHLDLPEPGVTVATDRGWLAQIITNLVGNAVKFTAEGGVTVRLALDGSVPPASMTLVVADTGIGISEEHHATIFRPFSQADGSVTRKYGGSGLGLTIARRLVNLLDGEITVESAPGRGTTFRVHLPVQRPEDYQAEAIREVSRPLGLDGTRVLIVEDQEEHRIMLERVLDRSGCEVATARNGREALEAVASWPYDLILMDLQMPEMDGIEAIRTIRLQERSGTERVPIVAITAHAMDTDEAEALDAGADRFITKPFTSDGLLEVVVAVTTDRARDGLV